jgi:hypothetical protein
MAEPEPTAGLSRRGRTGGGVEAQLKGVSLAGGSWKNAAKARIRNHLTENMSDGPPEPAPSQLLSKVALT